MADEHNLIQTVEEDVQWGEVIRHLVSREERRDYRKRRVGNHDNEETRGVPMRTNQATSSSWLGSRKATDTHRGASSLVARR